MIHPTLKVLMFYLDPAFNNNLSDMDPRTYMIWYKFFYYSKNCWTSLDFFPTVLTIYSYSQISLTTMLQKKRNIETAWMRIQFISKRSYLWIQRYFWTFEQKNSSPYKIYQGEQQLFFSSSLFITKHWFCI